MNVKRMKADPELLIQDILFFGISLSLLLLTRMEMF